MRLVFMGTPESAVPSLERLVEAGCAPAAVVTGPDRRRGRGRKLRPTPVKKAAERLGIERMLQPESVRDPAFAEEVAALAPDVIAVVAFKILPPEVFSQARLGAFNLHGSLLPKYRGAAPINRAIMAGERETGVTTFFLKERVDTGAVILREKMSIGPEETAGEVHDRMMELGAEVVVRTVRLIEAGEAPRVAQDDARATPAPKLSTEEARIPWATPAEAVHNHIRGLAPYPGAWTMHGDTRLKLYRTRLAPASPETAESAPGTVLEAGDRLVAACGEGTVEVLELQQPGGRRMNAADFLNGYVLEPGARLH